MNLNLNFLMQLTSPLEQFEINSCVTSLVYTTTFPLEIIENFYENCSNYQNKVSLYSFWSILFILLIVRLFQLTLKIDGFIFLFIFLIVLLSCFNLFSFSNIVTSVENSFTINNSSIFSETLPILLEKPHYEYWWRLKEFFGAAQMGLCVDPDVCGIIIDTKKLANDLYNTWVIDQFIPTYIFNEEAILSISLILAFKIQTLAQEGFISEEIVRSALTIFKSSLTDVVINYSGNGPLPDWSNFEVNPSVIKVKEFLDNHCENILRGLLDAIMVSNIIQLNKFGHIFDNTFLLWGIFIAFINAISFISENKMVFSNVKEAVYAINSFYELYAADLIMFVENENESLAQFQNMLEIVTGARVEPLYDVMERNIELFSPQLLWIAAFSEVDFKKAIPLIYDTNVLLGDLAIFGPLGSESVDFAVKTVKPTVVAKALNLSLNIENNFTDLILPAYQNAGIEYITLNTSIINVYHIFFCFAFIFIIIYLLFNKSLSNNSNTIIPNIYQIIGENIYKVSLNLFYSVLGKHLSHPEFFIKINTIFIFLIISNVQGMIPYMSTLTSALTNTFFIALALFISIIITLLDKKGWKYFLNLFMPSGCPILLVLLLIPIEIISYSFRVISLSVRLFANMMAGHTLLKVIVGFSWVIVFLGNTFLINLFPIAILFILTLLEFGVALIQAYIFTILSCIYLRDIFEGH